MVDRIDNLPTIRESFSKLNLRAKKSLGQNFLLDSAFTDKIAESAAPFKGTVIEIGPGPGGLTRSILLMGAHELIAIEKDPRAIAFLEELKKAASPRLQIRQADALAEPVWEFGFQPRQIIANLPYNIATPLLILWLKHANAFDKLTLMFQKEVAERIVAQPGETCFGRLSVLCDWLATAKILFEIPADAFLPKPKVTSAVVQLMPRKKLLYDCKINYLEKVTQIAFNQRRKMLRASFKKFGGTQMLTSLNIDPMMRPQDLSTESFCKLANHLGPQLG